MQKEANRHAPDIILRSSDKKLFRSWKILLSIASPVFDTMFTLPRPQPETSDDLGEHQDGLPVVDLEEDGPTLDHILILCHPPSCTRKRFEVDSIRKLQAVLEATVKYDMENARHVALEALLSPSLLCDDPLAVYALACRYECREAAVAAAKRTLALPSLVTREYVPELEVIHAGELYRLLAYRKGCVEAARSLAVDHRWIAPPDVSLFGSQCVSCKNEDLESTLVRTSSSRKYPYGRDEHISVHKWWMEYMRKSEYALRKRPHGDTVKDQKLVGVTLKAISASKCNQCNALQVAERFNVFVDTFAKYIDLCILGVRIQLGF